MGCGGSKRPPADGPEKDAQQGAGKPSPAPKVAEVPTWATKTGAAAELEAPAHAQGSSTLPGRHGEALLIEADDYDEIEIIQEATPKGKRSVDLRNGMEPMRPRDQLRHSANGQEAPQVDLRPTPAPAKPLSKQQMEEAAKLAERRKRFDNQRYQREQQSLDPPLDISAGGLPVDLTTFGSSASPQRGPTSSSRAPAAAPLHDSAALGLSLTEAGSASRDYSSPGAFLPQGMPGGIEEDFDTLQAVREQEERTRRNMNKHNDDFDDDDERLMKEILENCDN